MNKAQLETAYPLKSKVRLTIPEAAGSIFTHNAREGYVVEHCLASIWKQPALLVKLPDYCVWVPIAWVVQLEAPCDTASTRSCQELKSHGISDEHVKATLNKDEVEKKFPPGTRVIVDIPEDADLEGNKTVASLNGRKASVVGVGSLYRQRKLTDKVSIWIQSGTTLTWAYPEWIKRVPRKPLLHRWLTALVKSLWGMS